MERRSLWMVCILLALLAAASLAVDGQAAHLLFPANPVLEPLANAQGVFPNTHVGIDYDEGVDPTTVSPQTFATYGSQTGHVQQVLTVVDGNIDLTPSRPFHVGELVHVTATTQTLSIVDGLGPEQPTVWQFRVGVEGGTGYFGSNGQELDDGPGQDVELGDLDGDGDLDAFVANCGSSYVWRNIGSSTARFEPYGTALGSTDCSRNVSLGDLDGDGDLDVLMVTTAVAKVWFNNGSGKFSDGGVVRNDSNGTSAELGDLDGDGDLDFFYTVSGYPNWVYLNTGNGQFSPHAYTPDTDASTAAALGDLDGDGDLDAWVSASGDDPKYSVYLNDGHAAFIVWQTISSSPGNLVYPANSVSLGDLDGDGDLDAFLAVVRTSEEEPGPNQVWFNDGSGTFSNSGQRLGENSTNQIVLGDLDGDGDLDAVAINMNRKNEVWLNNGDGTYRLAPQIFARVDVPHAALGDLNADGSLDLYMVRRDETDSVMLNLWEFYPVYLPGISKR